MKRIIILFLFSSLLWGCTEQKKETKRPIDYVDPFIGTGFHGHTYPGATAPWGMVQLSPNNGTQGWDWTSGYHYSDSALIGFSHLHLAGTGIGDLAELLVTPTVNKVDLLKARIGKPETYDYKTFFKHENESAAAGYYQVKTNDGINCEMTSATRVGYHRYTFPQDTEATIVFDLANAINWDWPSDTFIEVIDSRHIQGYRASNGWAKDQKIHFYAEFSQPFTQYTLALDSTS